MGARVFRNARILIVDDEPINVDLLRRLLERAGFSRLASTNDSREAVDLYTRFRPDLILLDLHMPHRDGLDIMDELNQIAEASYLPILMLTGDDTPEAKREALSRGAKDFLNKPFHSDEVLLRIGTLLETRFLYLQIQSQNQILEAKVRDRTRELEAAQIEIIERLARAAEFRDDNTGQHTERVGQMAALLARQIGLSDTQVSLIRRAAPNYRAGAADPAPCWETRDVPVKIAAMRIATLASILLAGLATTAWAGDKAVNPPPATRLADFGTFELRQLATPALVGLAQGAAVTLNQHLEAQIKPILAGWKATAAAGGRSLVIQPVLVEMHYVSPQARGWGGQFAGGNSFATLHLRLTDAASGELVAEPEFYQQTDMSKGDTKGIADRNMLRHVARAAADYLKQNHDAAVGGPTGRD
jgi:DNA-binding response OmpR family regulator